MCVCGICAPSPANRRLQCFFSMIIHLEETDIIEMTLIILHIAAGVDYSMVQGKDSQGMKKVTRTGHYVKDILY